jgi:thiol reductant ABC exporter CydC subunit
VVSIVSVAAAGLILPEAGLILAGGLVAAGVLVPVLSQTLSRSTGARQASARGGLTADLIESLRGAPELVLYGRGDERLEAVRTADRELTRHARRDSVIAGLGTGLLVLVAGITTVSVLAAAVSAHAGGRLDRVLVATVVLLALASFEGVATLPAAAQELAATLAAGSRVLELVDRRALVSDPLSPLAAVGSAPTVALESVTARYATSDAPVLCDFDLTIDPGRRVALVGESGAGKTTVTRLLFRFLDPESGRLTIDGIDLRDLRQEDVRRTFALAGQEAHIFNSTVRENLLLARTAATDDELIAVLRRVRLGAWLDSLPLRLDTLVGEEGSRLSGGQRQRLVLARALLVDAPVLVLDEPTANLDHDTATRLMEDVFATAGERSILMITHRTEGLELVDEIYELEEGRTKALPA